MVFSVCAFPHFTRDKVTLTAFLSVMNDVCKKCSLDFVLKDDPPNIDNLFST